MTPNGINATVLRSTGSTYIVRTDDGQLLECRLRGRLRLDGSKSTNPVAVGDHVSVTTDDRGNVIAAVEQRHNCIVRRSTNLSKASHVIAANIDQALLIASLAHPETSTVFIDRFLASAEAFGVPTVIVFNKYDIYEEEQLETLALLKAVYSDMGYTVLETSTVSSYGIDAFKAALSGKVSAIAGNSGVGKSSLLNAVEPSLNLKTSDISLANDSGKHTTTFAEMHHLSFGADIIDTPGVRSYGLIDIDKEEVSHYFKDIFAVSPSCRYPNCSHTHEPGCAVISAVEEGHIALSRYDSYLNIMTENDEKYRQGYR